MAKRARVGLVLAGAALACACDKPPPDELVYTGPRVVSIDASLPMLDAALRPPPARDAGDAQVDEGGLVEPGDELAARARAECGAPPAADLPFSRPALFESAGLCARLHYCEFDVYRRELLEKVTAYRDQPGAATRAAAQEAWRGANARWQRAELFTLGPAAPLMDPGGRDLRAQIYRFPIDRCFVDELLVSQTFARPEFAEPRYASARGIAAVEYTLFYVGVDSGCGPAARIVTDGSWQALAQNTDELNARKRAYALRAVEELTAPTRGLVDAWGSGPGQGNFVQQLREAGRGSTVYPTERAAMNALGYALYYAELIVKDVKLMIPLGRSVECTSGGLCPDRVESRYAQVSTQNLADNLAAFRALFQGCGDGYGGLGIDDALRALGPDGAALADRMLLALTGAEQAVQTLDPPLEAALLQSSDKVVVVFQAVKALTDLLKVDMVTLLDIEPPMAAEGDND